MDWAILGVSTGGLVAATLALLYARRADTRASKRSDVGWKLVRTGVGHFAVVNLGRDTAYDVRAVLTIDERSTEAEGSSVAPNEPLVLASPTAAAMHNAAMEELARFRESRKPAEPGRIRIPLPRPVPGRFTASARVIWRSETKRWDEQTVTCSCSERFA